MIKSRGHCEEVFGRRSNLGIRLLQSFRSFAMTVGILFVLPSFVFAENIHYHIMQMGIKAGEADLNVKGKVNYQGKDLFLITFKADGFNFLDEEDIYLDPETLKPRFVNRNLNIFGSKERISEAYGEGEISITKTVGDKITTQVIKNVKPVDNIYGFIYRYRQTGSFAVGDEMDVILPTKDLRIGVVKRLKVSAAGKVYDGFYMQSKPSKYKLWFSADEKKLPLRISGAVGIANTVMVMADYKE